MLLNTFPLPYHDLHGHPNRLQWEWEIPPKSRSDLGAAPDLLLRRGVYGGNTDSGVDDHHEREDYGHDPLQYSRWNFLNNTIGHPKHGQNLPKITFLAKKWSNEGLPTFVGVQKNWK